MVEENLYRIVEVSVKRGTDRRAVGIMSVRQALELPNEPLLEYTNPDRSVRGAHTFITRDQLQAYVCG